ncbi:kynureninase [Amycolatopsis sp.]|jgi:kynureninase|uniref:kynureninase n=1 Tax=Amycolatopsis sp. TaxID=37632 RepID=UPI002E0C5358|nr:kynureninase [Amycolatopsis sp.]
MVTPITRAHLEHWDETDELGVLREEFVLPDGLIYLCGNSLGVLPRAASERVRTTVDAEWGQGLVGSWNTAGWFDKPVTVGDRLARLVGADSGEVLAADSTSVNLFKVLSAALALHPDRKTVVAEADSFPTDLYLLDGVTEMLGGYEHRLVENVEGALDDQVAVLLVNHVNYRTGRLRDMAALTELAHRHGVLTVWDLCHSAGALPVHLNACEADFAVGCTYKYLNGGPGSPAFVYVARRHQERARQPLSGWMGHASPFTFDVGYTPSDGIRRFSAGTPPIVSYAPLEASLDIWDRVDLDDVRAKSVKLTGLFIELAAGLDVVSPTDSTLRGSQVSLRHPESYAVMRALVDRGVVGDFRAPDMMRFGFTPLYTRYTDVWDALEILREILATESWRDPKYAVRAKVT